MSFHFSISLFHVQVIYDVAVLIEFVCRFCSAPSSETPFAVAQVGYIYHGQLLYQNLGVSWFVVENSHFNPPCPGDQGPSISAYMHRSVSRLPISLAGMLTIMIVLCVARSSQFLDLCRATMGMHSPAVRESFCQHPLNKCAINGATVQASNKKRCLVVLGVAVIFVMLITTVLISLVMLIIWRTPILLVILFLTVFGLIEGVYMSAVVTKIPQGGWLPFAVSILLVIIMRSWKYGHDKRYQYEMKHLLSEEDLGALIADTGAKRVPGLCFFYSDMLHGVPPIVSHYVKNIRSLHQVIVLITIRYIPVTTVLPNERFLVGCLRFRGAYRCIAQYGYMDIIDTEGEEFKTSVVETLKSYIIAKTTYEAELPQELEFSRESVQRFTPEDILELENTKVSGAIFVLGRTILRTTKDATWMGIIVTSIYQFLVNNCRSVIDTWRIPYANFLELGMRVDI
ncbi:hypothetical protein L7F22_041714 [Adiantum nelumboides]|nr:hypothetical protein [Adiantum nelumboides]